MKKSFYEKLGRREEFTTQAKAKKEISELRKVTPVIRDEFGKKVDPFDLCDSFDVLSKRSFFWEKNSRYQDYAEGFFPENK